MPLTPVPISSLVAASAAELDQLLIIETAAGAELKLTVGQVLAAVGVPVGVMYKSEYDTNGDGVVDDSEQLEGQNGAYYLNRANHSGTQAISTVTNLQTALDDKVDDSEKGVANGIATLDSGGKLNLSQFPFGLLLYQSVWDANTNTPALSDATGTLKHTYLINVAGTIDLGSGNITFAVGDLVVHDGSIWEKVPTSTVFSMGVTDITTDVLTNATGVISMLDTTHFAPSTDRQYVTDDQKDSLDNANAPDAANPVATMADIAAVGVSGSYPPSPNDAPIAAKNADQTFAFYGINQATIDAAYSGYPPSTFLTTDNVDFAAMQYMVDQACLNGTPLSFTGNYYMGAKDVVMPKIITSDKFTLYGYSNNIYFAGGKGWTRVRPTNISESQQQQNTSMFFHHVRFYGSGAGIGFAPAANTNSTFEGLVFWNFATAAIFRTTQNGNIQNLDMNECYDGVYIQTEENLPGLEVQTPSNGTRLWQPTYRHNVDGGTAITYLGSYGGDVHGAQIEGNGSILNGIEFNGQGLTVVKSFCVTDPHFESTTGFRNSAIKFTCRLGILRLISPEHDISDTGAGAAGNTLMMVDAIGTLNSPSTMVSIYDLSKWNPVIGGPEPSKLFRGKFIRWDIQHYGEEGGPWTALWSTTGGAVVPLMVPAGQTISQQVSNYLSVR